MQQRQQNIKVEWFNFSCWTIGLEQQASSMLNEQRLNVTLPCITMVTDVAVVTRITAERLLPATVRDDRRHRIVVRGGWPCSGRQLWPRRRCEDLKGHTTSDGLVASIRDDIHDPSHPLPDLIEGRLELGEWRHLTPGVHSLVVWERLKHQSTSVPNSLDRFSLLTCFTKISVSLSMGKKGRTSFIPTDLA